VVGQKIDPEARAALSVVFTGLASRRTRARVKACATVMYGKPLVAIDDVGVQSPWISSWRHFAGTSSSTRRNGTGPAGGPLETILEPRPEPCRTC